MTRVYHLAALIFLVTIFLTGASSKAGYKEVRGGDGIGGTLQDLKTHGQSQEISGQELYKLVQAKYASQLQRFPLLNRASSAFFVGYSHKIFYIETRKLNKGCFDPSTASTRHHEIWACQNDVEVRINKKWWDHSTDSTKADLLLHEFLTALSFKSASPDAVAPAFTALLNPTLSDNAVSLEFWRLKFGALYTRSQVELAVESMLDIAGRSCASKGNFNEFNAEFAVIEGVVELNKSDIFAGFLLQEAGSMQLKEPKSFLIACGAPGVQRELILDFMTRITHPF